MNFAVTGIAGDTAGSAFSMQIIRCRDGALVFSEAFRKSTSSTAIEDAVMLLLKGRVPLYSESNTAEVNIR
jgi:hypothetical protein